jgi:hypothetical protein
MEENFDELGFTYKDLVEGIEAHERSEFVGIERNDVNGYVTIQFRGTDGEVISKMSFDEISEDMIPRAHAVLDYLATTHLSTISQQDINAIWDADLPGFSL